MMDLSSTNNTTEAKARGAMLGLAVGDSLGWPVEDRAHRLGQMSAREIAHSRTFVEWKRRAGGRYYAHEELIRSGEYSDDTQLTLATARSLMMGEDWWLHLTRRELPFWTLYERGGGSATRRSAQCWLQGIEPWDAADIADVRKYYEAGGNGVAMRIVPHCIRGFGESYESIATDITANGVSTHGHPRALVGALAYGYAVRLALQTENTLDYGAIVDHLILESDCWARIPDVAKTAPTWRSKAEITIAGYERVWSDAVSEMITLLSTAQSAMKRGALCIDHEVLQQLGCFDPKVKGAGTVAAAASVFLASRYAADPTSGIALAASIDGVDADTIAAMAGGILGAVHGDSWLADYSHSVQDSGYICHLAEALASSAAQNLSKPVTHLLTKGRAESWVKKLSTLAVGAAVELPDGRKGHLEQVFENRSIAKTACVRTWRIAVDDGQSLYAKKVSRSRATTASGKDSTSDQQTAVALQLLDSDSVIRMALKLPVADVSRSRRFYESTLGVRVTKETSSGTLVLGDMIALVPHSYIQRIGVGELKALRSLIYIESDAFDGIWNNITLEKSTVITAPTRDSTGKRYLRCLDPDGNIVEVFDRRAGVLPQNKKNEDNQRDPSLNSD